jgi:hypothetical protein
MATRYGHPGLCRIGAVIPLLLISLISDRAWAGEPPSPEETARFESEWEKIRENYERELRAFEKRIMTIDAQEREFSADPQARAAKITKDRADEVEAYLKRGGRGEALTKAAAEVARQATTSVEMSASDAYVDSIASEWRDGAERTKLQEARTALRKNIELINSYLAVMTEAVEGTSTHVPQSGVIEKATETDAALKEVREWLTARWERERAGLEREREQRAREAGERARGRP